jgi:hypothetical protein
MKENISETLPTVVWNRAPISTGKFITDIIFTPELCDIAQPEVVTMPTYQIVPPRAVDEGLASDVDRFVFKDEL